MRIRIEKYEAAASSATATATGRAKKSWHRSRCTKLDFGAMVSQECVV